MSTLIQHEQQIMYEIMNPISYLVERRIDSLNNQYEQIVSFVTAFIQTLCVLQRKMICPS